MLFVELEQNAVVGQARDPWHLERLRQRHLERRTNQGIHEDTRPTDLGPLDQSTLLHRRASISSVNEYSP